MKALALLLLVCAPSLAWAGDLYSLSTADSSSQVKAGERGRVVIAFSLAEGAHVSDEAPLKISLSGAQVTLDKATLTLADSTTSRKEGQGAAPRFEVPFVAARGASAIEARLSFFVCTATQCVRQTRTLTIPLEVQ